MPRGQSASGIVQKSNGEIGSAGYEPFSTHTSSVLMKLHSSHDRFALTLLMTFVLIWVALAIRPLYRADWLLENAIVFAVVPALALMHRRLPLSRISYTLIFVFSCLHEVGAHYTYAEVPYDQWVDSVTGRGLNERIG
jgi:putative membrane protein